MTRIVRNRDECVIDYVTFAHYLRSNSSIVILIGLIEMVRNECGEGEGHRKNKTNAEVFV